MPAVSNPNPWGYGLGGWRAWHFRLLRTVHSKECFWAVWWVTYGTSPRRNFALLIETNNYSPIFLGLIWTQGMKWVPQCARIDRWWFKLFANDNTKSWPQTLVKGAAGIGTLGLKFCRAVTSELTQRDGRAWGKKTANLVWQAWQ